MMSPLGWMRTAKPVSLPWKLVVRTPPMPKVLSRLPLVSRCATPNTEVPLKSDPTTTICPLGWTATAPGLWCPASSVPVNVKGGLPKAESTLPLEPVSPAPRLPRKPRRAEP